MIGPYNESQVKLEVEISEPEQDIFRDVLEQMRANGIKVCVGGQVCLAGQVWWVGE